MSSPHDFYNIPLNAIIFSPKDKSRFGTEPIVEWGERHPFMREKVFSITPQFKSLRDLVRYLWDRADSSVNGQSEKLRKRRLSHELLKIALIKDPDFLNTLSRYIQTYLNRLLADKEFKNSIRKDIEENRELFFYREIDEMYMEKEVGGLSIEQRAVLWMWYFIGSNPEKYIEKFLEDKESIYKFYQSLNYINRLLTSKELKIEALVDPVSKGFVNTFLCVFVVAELATQIRDAHYNSFVEKITRFSWSSISNSEEYQDSLETALRMLWQHVFAFREM